MSRVGFKEGDRVCTITGRCGTVKYVKEDDYGHEYSSILFDQPSQESLPSHMLVPEPAMCWRKMHRTECRNCGATHLMNKINVNHDEWLVTVYLCLMCGYTETIRE